MEGETTMLRKQPILAVYFFGLTLILNAQEAEVKITSPADGAKVPYRLLMQGTVTGKGTSEIWVVIHPMETSEYWVQPRLSVREGGNWSVQVYIGEAGKKDVGKQFEIRAVGNPEEPLKEGQTLTDWPKAKIKSQVIIVERDKK
jgi:hypothetical protein